MIKGAQCDWLLLFPLSLYILYILCCLINLSNLSFYHLPFLKLDFFFWFILNLWMKGRKQIRHFQRINIQCKKKKFHGFWNSESDERHLLARLRQTSDMFISADVAELSRTSSINDGTAQRGRKGSISWKQKCEKKITMSVDQILSETSGGKKQRDEERTESE